MEQKPKTLLDYIDTPDKRKELLALFPSESRDGVRRLIHATAELKGYKSDLLAAHASRVSHAICEIESKELSGKSDPVKLYEIGLQETEEYSDELGFIQIMYHDSTIISGGWFRGLRGIDKNGGVTITFYDGLPVGAKLFIFLYWTEGETECIISPSSAVQPATSYKGCDVSLRVSKDNKRLVVCIKAKSEMGAVSTGVQYYVFY